MLSRRGVSTSNLLPLDLANLTRTALQHVQLVGGSLKYSSLWLEILGGGVLPYISYSGSAAINDILFILLIINRVGEGIQLTEDWLYR